VIQLNAFTLSELFPLGALILVTATLPIALTSRAQPATPASVQFSWKMVFGASQVGVVASAISGFVMGLLWSVGAVYASELAGAVEVGARFIAVVIFGGLVLQFPIGRLSDAVDRRWIILWLGGLGFLGANLWLVHPLTGPWLYVAGFLCGAAAMPMYSVSIAHANDNANGQFLQIASGMLMANAIGAVVGPLLFAGVRLAGLPQALMVIMALAFATGAVWTILRLRTHSVDRAHFEPYQPLPKTTAEAAVLDPRQAAEQDAD
jgi:MFS family permease